MFGATAFRHLQRSPWRLSYLRHSLSGLLVSLLIQYSGSSLIYVLLNFSLTLSSTILNSWFVYSLFINDFLDAFDLVGAQRISFLIYLISFNCTTDISFKLRKVYEITQMLQCYWREQSCILFWWVKRLSYETVLKINVVELTFTAQKSQ